MGDVIVSAGQSAPMTALPAVPETWPGAFGIYKYSKAAVRINLWDIIGLFILSLAVSIALEAILKTTGQFLANLLGIYFTLASTMLLLASARRERLRLVDALKKSLNVVMYLKFLVVMLLSGLAIGFGFLLLIIPGIIILPRLILVPYFFVDQNLGISDSINKSWAITKGHSGKLWGVIGAGFAMALLMITIIGIPFSIYFLLMYSAAYAVTYYFIIQHSNTTIPPAPIPAPLTPPAAPQV